MSISELKRQSIVSFTTTIVYTVVAFVSTMYFAHSLGASILGTYSLFIAYYTIIDMVGDGGFGRAAVKRISEGEEQNEYFSAFFVLRTLTTGVIIFSLFIWKSLMKESSTVQIVDWLILTQFIALFYCLISKGIAGRGKMGVRSIGDLINNLSCITIQIIAVFLGYKLTGLVGGFIAGLLIATIIQFRFFDLHLVRFKWEHIKSLGTFSFWMFLTSTGIVLYSSADVIMIGHFLDTSQVGIYKAAFQLTIISTILTSSLSSTLWPKISRWGKIGNRESIEETLTTSLTVCAFIAMPIFVGGLLLGERMLYFFYGKEFAEGYSTLIILLFAQILNVFQHFFTTYLGALDKQKDSFKITIVAVIANIIINFLIIPLIGIEGAAIATLVTIGINAFLAKRVLSRIINIRVNVDSLFNTLKATSIMLIFIFTYRFVVPLNSLWILLLLIISSAFIYFYFMLKFDRDLFNNLKDILVKMNIMQNRLL